MTEALTNWNMDFAFASLFMLSVLLVYNIICKDLPLRKNMIFNTLLLSIAAADILDIISSTGITRKGTIPPSAVYSSILVYYAIVLLIPILLFFMVVALAGRLGKAPKKVKVLTALFFILLEALIFTTPITGFLFEYSEESGYIRHMGCYVICLTGGLILLVSCIYVYRHRNVIRLLQRRSIYSFSVITSLSCFIQAFVFSDLSIICSGYTLSALIMYIAVQNPDYYREQRTGLFSRDGFDELQNEYFWEKRKSSILCFTFADYGVIKNTYGDQIIRPCLRSIAKFVKREVCSKGVIPFYVHNGRFLLMKTGYYDFAEERMKIDKRFRDPWTASGNSFRFSPAYAYISYDIKMKQMQEVHSLIEKALTDAVKNGAFSFISIDEEFMKDARHEVKIRRALDNALKNDSLEVWYQPIWSPFTNRVNSAEALVRINDPELGIIYPDEFIKTAESNGSIMILGRQVYKKVCGFVSRYDIRKYGLDFIDVNISPVQCLNEHLADELISIRKSYGVEPGLINLEITETAASDSPVMVENMLKLSRDGFSFSLDDYGTGYSNLMTMLSLPLSNIKIDKSIVWTYFDQTMTAQMAAGAESIVSDDGLDNILEDLIPMFQARGLKVVCEGVENNEEVRILEEMGCDYMQGFYFSRPIPEEEFISFVSSINRGAAPFGI